MTRLGYALVALLAFALPACADDKKDAVRVACVGDSITYGYGVEDRTKNCYPAVLQKLLGEKYDVRNFGVSGATLLNAGDRPYTKEKAYKDALAFNPHVVVIKLGSNDTKPQNWKHADDYAGDYKALIESFQKLETKPKVYLCTPVPAYPAAFGITDEVLKTGVKPKVEALGKEPKLPVIDLYAALSDKPKLFPDKVHPNAEGAKLIAETVHAAIK
jgi:lysophospholipase L1-like esterase